MDDFLWMVWAASHVWELEHCSTEKIHTHMHSQERPFSTVRNKNYAFLSLLKSVNLVVTLLLMALLVKTFTTVCTMLNGAYISYILIWAKLQWQSLDFF